MQDNPELHKKLKALRPRMYQWAWSILRDEYLAEDAVQEALMEFSAYFPRIREPNAAPAIARRMVIKSADRIIRKDRELSGIPEIEQEIVSPELGWTLRDIQASLDSGAFDRFILSDRMINKSLMNTFGKKLKKSTGYISGSIGKGANYFHKVAEAGGIDSSAPYVGESYDAAALIVLAMQAGQSSDKKTIANNIMNIANSPGIKIYPGELKKGIELLKKGKEIDYEGASRVNFTTNGETKGSFLELKFKGKKFISNKQR